MSQIILTEQECIDIFYNALCNGITVMQGYGLDLDWNGTFYKESKVNWSKNSKNEGCVPCYEDIIMQMLLDGGELHIVDNEGEGDNDSTITIKDVIERVPKTPMQHLVDVISENDDATTADVILQTVFYEEVIFV